MIELLAAIFPVVTMLLLIGVGTVHLMIAHETRYYGPFMAWALSYVIFIGVAVPTYFYGYIDETGLGRVYIFALRIVAQILQLWAALMFLRIYRRETR